MRFCGRNNKKIGINWDSLGRWRWPNLVLTSASQCLPAELHIPLNSESAMCGVLRVLLLLCYSVTVAEPHILLNSLRICNVWCVACVTVTVLLSCVLLLLSFTFLSIQNLQRVVCHVCYGQCVQLERSRAGIDADFAIFKNSIIFHSIWNWPNIVTCLIFC